MNAHLNRAVFLDRDGVINRPIVRNGKPYPAQSEEEFVLMPDVVDGCHRLKAAGFLLVVATNQPDVGRGTLSRQAVEAIHEKMCQQLPIDRVEVCFDPDDTPASIRRKPGFGMLSDAASTLGIDLKRSFMVGDRWRDIDCGRAAGCVTLLVDWSYDERLRSSPDFRVSSLAEAVDVILTYGN